MSINWLLRETDLVKRPADMDEQIMFYLRGAAIVNLLLVLPIVQITASRVVPVSLGVSVLLILAGHVLTGTRLWSAQQLFDAFTPARWTAPQRIIMASFAAYVLFNMVSLFWSPDADGSWKQIALLILFFPLSAWFASEFSQANLTHIGLLLRIGVLVSAILLMLELTEATALHRTFSNSSELWDLNRNAVLLALLVWLLPLFSAGGREWKSLDVLLLAAVALYLSHSQTAQLAFITAAAVGLIIHYMPILRPVIYAGMVAVMIALPFQISVFSSLASNSPEALAVEGHAEHRLLIWQGYADKIKQRPVLGWGIGASRVLGEDGVIQSSKYDEKALNPHNFVLEIWTNFGAIGAILSALILTGLGWISARMKPLHGRVATQLTVAVFVSGLVGSAMMQAWFVTTIALVLILYWVGIRKFAADLDGENRLRGK